MADVLEESDLRAGLKDGGQVLGAFIIARSEDEFVIYMRPSWGRGRGFRIIRTWRGASGDRSFKNLQSAWSFVRKFDFFGRVTVYPVGDAELRQFVGVNLHDLQASSKLVGSDGHGPPQNVPDPARPQAVGAAPDFGTAAHLAGPDGNAHPATLPVAEKPPRTTH